MSDPIEAQMDRTRWEHDGNLRGVAAHMVECADSWEGRARLIGNARAEDIGKIAREYIAMRAFVERISKQKPAKPDYWSECHQCNSNQMDADDIINPS